MIFRLIVDIVLKSLCCGAIVALASLGFWIFSFTPERRVSVVETQTREIATAVAEVPRGGIPQSFRDAYASVMGRIPMKEWLASKFPNVHAFLGLSVARMLAAWKGMLAAFVIGIGIAVTEGGAWRFEGMMSGAKMSPSSERARAAKWLFILTYGSSLGLCFGPVSVWAWLPAVIVFCGTAAAGFLMIRSFVWQY